MAFLSKKKDAAAEDVPLEPVLNLSDDANWHLWLDEGIRVLKDGDVVTSVAHLIQFVDRFDGDAKDLSRAYDRITGATIELILEKAGNGKAVPTHILADIDNEVRIKHRDMYPETDLMGRIMDGCEAQFGGCATINELVMIATGGAYAGLGFLRYSPDVRDDLIVSGRCCEMEVAASQRVPEIGKAKGNLSPKLAYFYVANFAKFYDIVKIIIRMNLEGYEDSELDALAEKHVEEGMDCIAELVEAMDASNSIPTNGKLGRRKLLKNRETHLVEFVERKLPKKKA